jgi:glycosyltransferase involved in cell wall biosynthesis
LKILIISDVAPPMIGGGESYVINVGSVLANLGHEVHWLTAKIPGTLDNESFSGIQIHRIQIPFSSRFIFPGRQTFPFMLLVNRISLIDEMDIIQTNTLVAGYTGWRLAKKYRKPSLLFCHELYGDLWKRIGSNPLEKLVYPWIEKRIATSPYDWFAAPSQYSKQTLVNAGTPSDRISVIHHGINQMLFRSSIDGGELRTQYNLGGMLLFGYIGRLRVRSTAQAKNIPMLIRTVKNVIQKIPNARLVLAGKGYEEILPIILKEKVEKYVVYLGEMPYHDNPRFIRMCDIIVCPSLADGFCFMLAEAASCGRAVVATSVGSHFDRVKDGKTGLLASPNVDALSNAIVDLLSCPTKLREMGYEAEKSVASYTWESCARKHEQIYEKLIDNYNSQVM